MPRLQRSTDRAANAEFRAQMTPRRPVPHREADAANRWSAMLLAPDDKARRAHRRVTPDNAAAAGLGTTTASPASTGAASMPWMAGPGSRRHRNGWGALDGSRGGAGYERDGAARVSLTPGRRPADDRARHARASFDGNVQVFRSGDGDIEVLADRIRAARHRRIPPSRPTCATRDHPAGWRLQGRRLQVARWPERSAGTVNLAAVDGGLAMADKGAGAQHRKPAGPAGRVVRAIDGKPVASPARRDGGLRARKASEGEWQVEFLRDKATRARTSRCPRRCRSSCPPGMAEHRKMVFVGWRWPGAGARWRWRRTERRDAEGRRPRWRADHRHRHDRDSRRAPGMQAGRHAASLGAGAAAGRRARGSACR